jgi:predicted metal-binding membrane protein
MHGFGERVAPNFWLSAAVFAGGWTLMTIAMMLPASVPLLLRFHRMIDDRSIAIWLVTLLVAGYLTVWMLSGVVLHLLVLGLRAGVAHLVWPAMTSTITGAALLGLAGLYQFSSVKYACLDQCRSPLLFLTSRWHGGYEPVTAFRIGVDHGIFCVGCCWSLMLLMFVVGASSLGWMLLLGIAMALERNTSLGRQLSAPIGAVLLIGAVVFLAAGISSRDRSVNPKAFIPSICRRAAGNS